MALTLHPLPQRWHLTPPRPEAKDDRQQWYSSLFTTAATDTIWSYRADEWTTPPQQHCGHESAAASSSSSGDEAPAESYLSSEALEQLIQQEHLALRVCKHGEACYGRYSRCPFLHTLRDILALFNHSALLALYRDGAIKDTEPRPQRWHTRDADEFACHNTPECRQARSDYALRLKHDTSELLKYPVCRIFCTHCRKTRSLPIYV